MPNETGAQQTSRNILQEGRRGTPRQDVVQILAMVAVVVFPVLLTLSRVRATVADAASMPDPTPRGYTYSLLIFAVPVAVIGLWHSIRPRTPEDRRAFWWAAGAMALIGSVLDVVFGYTFFYFPNTGATLGIRAPAWSFCLPETCEMGWVMRYIPIEEFGFYILGAIYMVSVYIWADRHWMQAYAPKSYNEAARSHDRILEPSWKALALWALLVVLGVVWKRIYGGGGVPGYFIFLMVLGFLPSFLLFRTVVSFVNWRALAFAFGALVFLSVIWEATLGVPYGWWRYKSPAMLEIYFKAWSNLPLEAVLLWMVGAWDAIMAYEFFRIFFRMQDRAVKARLLGFKHDPRP